MDIEFDSTKDARNIAKHGVSLEEAENFDMSTALVRYDDRRDEQTT